MAKSKIQKADINRNSSIQLSHTIRKLKENERKYTIILVIFFMILFIFIGYNSLKVDSGDLSSSVVKMHEAKNVIVESESIVLDTNNIMNDSDGLDSKAHYITVKNNRNTKLKYKVVFVVEDVLDKCDCLDTYNLSDVRYSVDRGLRRQDLLDNNGVIYEGELSKYSSKTLDIRMWINDEVDSSNYHLHGYFIIKEIHS